MVSICHVRSIYERRKNALWSDDSDEQHKRSDNTDKDTLHLCVIGYGAFFTRDVCLEVVTTSYTADQQDHSGMGKMINDLLASI